MMFSVKFFEPIVIVGLLPFSALDWMTLESAAWVLVVEAAAPELFVLPESLLSSSPHAASPRVRPIASRARTLRDRMRRFLLLGVVGFWESLRPRGVTARWRAAKKSSAPMA